MMRRILIHIRNFIDSLLTKTSYPKYTIYNTTFKDPSSNNTCEITFCTLTHNQFANNTITGTATNGIWLDNYTAGGNQT